MAMAFVQAGVVMAGGSAEREHEWMGGGVRRTACCSQAATRLGIEFRSAARCAAPSSAQLS